MHSQPNDISNDYLPANKLPTDTLDTERKTRSPSTTACLNFPIFSNKCNVSASILLLWRSDIFSFNFLWTVIFARRKSQVWQSFENNNYGVTQAVQQGHTKTRDCCERARTNRPPVLLLLPVLIPSLHCNQRRVQTLFLSCFHGEFSSIVLHSAQSAFYRVLFSCV